MPKDDNDGFAVGGTPPGVGADDAAEDVSALPAGDSPASQATEAKRPVDYPAGLPPVVITHAAYHELANAQAAHAQRVQIQDLARRNTAVRVLVEEVEALRAKVAELEAVVGKASKKK